MAHPVFLMHIQSLLSGYAPDPAVLVLLLIFPVFSFSNSIGFYQRRTAEHSAEHTTKSPPLLNIVVCAAAVLIKRRTRRWGKQSLRAHEAQRARI